MKLCGIFLVLALAGAASAASIGQQPRAFTAELDDGFVATLPKSAVAATEQDKENSLEPVATPNAEENQNKKIKSPALSVHKETHIAVQIVRDPENISTKKNDPVADEDKAAVKVEEIAKEPSKVEVVNAEEINSSDSKKPADDDEAECEVEKKLNKIEKTDSVKDVPVEVNEEEKQESGVEKSEEQLRQDVVVPAVSPPNIFQQGLATIQNIGSSIISLVIPNNNSSSPGIFSNIQQQFQNFVNPQANASAPAPVLPIFQGLSDFTTGIQSVITNIQNVASGFFGNSANNTRNATSTGILQQSIQNLQQGVQTGLQNLNQTIQAITNPSEDRPGLIQSGIQNLQQGVQNILQPSNDSRPGVIQQTVQNLSEGLQSGVQTLNNTIQNIINPVADGEAPRPGIVQNIQSGIQNLVGASTAAPVVSTRETLEQTVLGQLQSINQTLLEGVKSLADSLESMHLVPEQKVQVAPVGDVEIIDA